MGAGQGFGDDGHLDRALTHIPFRFHGIDSLPQVALEVGQRRLRMRSGVIQSLHAEGAQNGERVLLSVVGELRHRDPGCSLSGGRAERSSEVPDERGLPAFGGVVVCTQVGAHHPQVLAEGCQVSWTTAFSRASRSVSSISLTGMSIG